MVKSGYKQTEIGIIPEDWEYVNAEKYIDFITGFAFASNLFSTTGTKLLRGSNVKRNVIDWSENITKYWQQNNNKLKSYELEEGDIVISMDGSLVGRSFGQINKIDLPALLVQRVARVRGENSSTNFLKHLYCSEFFTKHCDNNKTASAIPHISPRDIREYKILIPKSLPEQQTIAEALSDADAWIESLEQLIAKKRLLKQGAMQELLTPKEDWEVKKLGEVSDIIIGLTYSPNDVKDFGTLVLRSSNVQNNKLAFENNVFVEMELPKRVIVRENDILVCVRNGSKQLIGKCALIDKKTEGQAFGAFMSIIRSQFGKYLFYYFQTNHIQIQIDENLGATINQLTSATLKAFDICFPNSVNEQTRIATILSDMDLEIEALSQQLEKAKQIKQGMMQELLTGRIRLV